MSKEIKRCLRCLNFKPISEFYRHASMADGHLNKCKQCAKVDARTYRRKNIHHCRAYDRNRGCRITHEYTQRWRLTNQAKYKAHCALNNAIRDKKISKEPCFMCGSAITHAHHVDYTKPLDVIWLCAGCHQLQHAYEAKVRKIKNTGVNPKLISETEQ